MLDGLLGRGFASKCKSLIKLIKSRIDVIRRKRNATQKFLKKDMADLLANGLDINAYGRAEGLLVELTLSSCYDFVEHRCDFLLNQLSTMQKQSECPEECREAVSSLMHAAARFSDLPELRDLRQVFQERYGNSLDHCLNRQFAEKINAKSFTMEQKVQLMQDITSEFSISWNARNFEQQMSKASSDKQEPMKSNGFYHLPDDSYKVPNNIKEIPPVQDNHKLLAVEASNNGQRFRKGLEADSLKKDEFNLSAGRSHSSDDRIKQDRSPRRGKQDYFSDRKAKGSSDPKIMRPDASSQRKGDRYAENGTKHNRANEKSVVERENGDIPVHLRPGYAYGLPPTSSNSEVKITPFVREYGVRDHNDHNPLARVKSEGDRPYEDKFAATSSKSEVKVTSFVRGNGDEHVSTNSLARVKSEGDRPYSSFPLPPPYVKPNIKAKDASHRSNSEKAPANPEPNGVLKSPTLHRSTSPDQRFEGVEKAVEDVRPARSSRADEKEIDKHLYEENGFPFPKPRSSRRRHSKSRSAHDEACDHNKDDDGVKRSSRSRRRDDPRKGLQILFDNDRSHKDEEERIIDKLLIHYSKKPSTYEGERSKRKSRSRRHHDDVGKQVETERPDEEFGVFQTPRSVSLPLEQPSAPSEPTKIFTRAATFQLDQSSDAKHVHPKLPDYDDLAARFAAMKG